MERLVLEDPDCKISEIIKAIRKSPVVGQLDGNLYALALDMNVPSPDINKIRRETQGISGMSTMDALDFFLKNWRMRLGPEAKLITFIEMLEDLDLNDLANSLRKRFAQAGERNNSSNASGGDEKSEDAAGKKVDDPKLIKRQQDRIDQVMPDLVLITEWNVPLKATFRTEGILTEIDLLELDDLPNRLVRMEALFKKIRNRLPGQPEIYDIVIKAFGSDDQRQSGVAKLLKLP